MKLQQALSPDRRRAIRREVRLEARIRLEHGVYVPCIIRNISCMGASVELNYDAFVPLQFRLQIPGDLFEAECALRHRHGAVLGLEFLSNRAEAMARYS
jgi:hypothetical protein